MAPGRIKLDTRRLNKQIISLEDLRRLQPMELELSRIHILFSFGTTFPDGLALLARVCGFRYQAAGRLERETDALQASACHFHLIRSLYLKKIRSFRRCASAEVICTATRPGYTRSGPCGMGRCAVSISIFFFSPI